MASFIDGNQLKFIDTISAREITPESFYERFIQRRVPCKIIGHIDDPLWNGVKLADFRHLRAVAGKSIIKVEIKGDSLNYTREFGNGIDVTI
jgi:hypothetical protein